MIFLLGKKPTYFHQDKQKSILFTRELIQNKYFTLKPWVTSHFMCSMLIKKKKQIAWPGSSMHVVYECMYLHSWLHSMSKTKEWGLRFLDVHYNLFFFNFLTMHKLMRKDNKLWRRSLSFFEHQFRYHFEFRRKFR